MLKWLRNLFGSAQTEPLVLTEEVKVTKPKTPTAKKPAAKKAPAKKKTTKKEK